MDANNKPELRVVQGGAPPTDADFERLWDVDEVAAFLGIPRNGVYKRTAAGLIPHRKIGRVVRYIPGDIRAWVRKQPGTGVGGK